MELVLTILLAIASVILAVNGLLTMYKCMCSRNYARWRSSWQRRRHVRRRWRGDAAGYYIEFRETVPLVLSGHKQVTYSQYNVTKFFYVVNRYEV